MGIRAVLNLPEIEKLYITSQVVGDGSPTQKADETDLSLTFFDAGRLAHGDIGRIRMTKQQFTEIVHQGCAFFGMQVKFIEKEAGQK